MHSTTMFVHNLTALLPCPLHNFVGVSRLKLEAYCAVIVNLSTWWHHQMETFSALLALCVGNSPVPGEFPAQRPVTRSFDVLFDLRPNKWLSKQWWGWWFETQSCPLWRHCNEIKHVMPLNNRPAITLHSATHDDFMTWGYFPYYWLPHAKGQ